MRTPLLALRGVLVLRRVNTFLGAVAFVHVGRMYANSYGARSGVSITDSCSDA